MSVCRCETIKARIAKNHDIAKGRFEYNGTDYDRGAADALHELIEVIHALERSDELDFCKRMGLNVESLDDFKIERYGRNSL